MAQSLIENLIGLDKYADDARLYVMAQNPANYHHWSKPIGPIVTAGELRDALNKLGGFK
ncbi:MAG: hypothetical protein ACK4FB_07950 [Brevundimonas sp.]|uniref:hypothetical protein n=1 Tax=Brevundimonas sp. TaxID=1871086 RepID=UPI0039190BBD